ncbi:uncharacterized protein LOC119970512 [Scyliorhinus canicula]|uniref:uncharacterized protein LOC119970512 n=1 Tax=Scyliorhinus canicula TaxID=7830 RepID=UPI0018F288F6|nr:uncharacterized protein LOC119970512 [Scyliorhinus canicula]
MPTLIGSGKTQPMFLGQLGQGENVRFLTKPCCVSIQQLRGCVQQIAAGDCYSCALTANGELFMWGRNCHVIDANRPASHKFWSPQKIDLGIQDIHSVSCGYWHATALTGYPAERHHGNKESGFSETGESFKGDNRYPKLMEPSQEEKRDGIQATELKNTEDNLENLQSAIQPGKEGTCQYVTLTQCLNRMDEPQKDNIFINSSIQSSHTLRGAGKSEASVGTGNEKEQQKETHSSLLARRKSRVVYLPKRKQLQRNQNFTSIQSLPDTEGSTQAGQKNKGNLPLLGLTQHVLQKVHSQKDSSNLWSQCNTERYGKEIYCPKSTSDGSLPIFSSSSLHTRTGGGFLHARTKSGVQPISVYKGRPRMTPHLSPLTCDTGTQFILDVKSTEKIASRPVCKQPIYSSGTAWKDVSKSPDPVLSQKHLNPNSSCS